MNHKSETPKSAIGNRKSQIYSPINPFAHSHIHFFMQNEANYNPPNKLKRHLAMPDSTNNKLSILTVPCAPGINTYSPVRAGNRWKGPNFTPPKCRSEEKIRHRRTKRTQFHQQRTNESRKRRRFHPQLFLRNTQKKRELFQKNQKMRAFCKYLKTTNLTPYTTKTYITFHLRYRVSRIKNRAPKKCKTNPIQLFYCSPVLISRPWRGEPNSRIEHQKSRIERLNMQNEHNSTPTAHMTTSHNGSRVTIHPKRTQFHCSPVHLLNFLALGAPRVTIKYAKQTQFRIYPNNSSLRHAQRATGHKSRVTNKNAKRTQSNQRATKDEKRATKKMQNEPNLQTERTYVLTRQRLTEIYHHRPRADSANNQLSIINAKAQFDIKHP